MVERPASKHLSVVRTQAILGVDPGLHGALVVYDPVQNTVSTSHIIPTLVLTRNGNRKRTLDIPRLVVAIRELHAQFPDLYAVLELVGAHRMHGRTQGASSMFSFGFTAGSIETALVAEGIQFTKVPPATWKTALNCSQDKDIALERASELIPAGTSHWTPKRLVRTKEDCKGVAEAAMIAYWGAASGRITALPLAA